MGTGCSPVEIPDNIRFLPDAAWHAPTCSISATIATRSIQKGFKKIGDGLHTNINLKDRPVLFGERGLCAAAMALLALGELHRLGEVLDVSRDDTGLMLDIDGLPLACSYPPVPRLSDLSELRRLAAAAGNGPGLAPADRDRLLGSAGSLGGARPKANVRDESRIARRLTGSVRV